MATYYVSTSGVGSGPGGIGSPWSLTYAASGAGGTIVAGDTVLLRGGTYSSVTGWTFTVAGSAGNLVTFAAYPGETPILDGAIAAYTTIGNTAWTLHDAGTNTWKTTSTGMGSGTYAGFIELSGKWYPLATHKNLTGLMATTQNYRVDGNYYMGPGILEDATGGQVYARLESPLSAAQEGRTTVTVSDLDPRNHNIRLFTAGAGIAATGGYLVFDGLTINDFYQLFTVGNNVTVRNCTGRFGFFFARVPSSSGVIFDGCIMDGYMDSADYWVAWHDVKSGVTNADATRKNALELEASSNVLITNCTIARLFDGILASGAHDIEVSNCAFTNVWDDAWQMYGNIYQINFHHNTCLGAGPSHDSAGTSSANPDPGTVYIHHNIIDTNVNLIFTGRNETALDGDTPTKKEGMFGSLPMSTHGTPTGYGFPWKVYYNTILSTFTFIDGYVDLAYFGRAATNHYSGIRHEVYNNVLDGAGVMGRDFDANTGREIYDGNVYNFNYYKWRFIHTSTGTLDAEVGGGVAACATVAGMKASQAFPDSQVYYAPGWENSGLEVDPVLDSNYLPATASVLTGAVDLTAKGWPGTESYEAHRGAVGPTSTVRIRRHRRRAILSG